MDHPEWTPGSSDPGETPGLTTRGSIFDAFAARFGAAPSLIARAPGRVELMGSHTDYNLGRVLTLPIDRDLTIVAGPRDDRQVRVASITLGEEDAFSLDAIERGPAWTNYVRGVAAMFEAEGARLTGVDAVIESTIPLSAGLSSSAALECATAVLFEAVSRVALDPVRRARLCRRAENEFAGVNCGILDQYSACVDAGGGALLLDCRDLTSEPVAIDPGIAVVVCDTRSPREVRASEYGVRHTQCEEGARLLGAASLREAGIDRLEERARELPPIVERRCRFVLEEDARAVDCAEALRSANRRALARLTELSFRGARDLFEMTSPAMEAMARAIEAAPGAVGGRQSGAGFGGLLVAFVDAGDVEAFVAAVTEGYARDTGLTPAVFAVAPGRPAGAGRLN